MKTRPTAANGATVVVLRAGQLSWAYGIALSVVDVLLVLVALYIYRELRRKDYDQAWRAAY